MGVCNSELYNNLALCCFYSQQHDMAVMCFERALALATDETLSDVWYNIGHLALVIYYIIWILNVNVVNITELADHLMLSELI